MTVESHDTNATAASAPRRGSAPDLAAGRRNAPPWLPLLVVAAAWIAQGGALTSAWSVDGRALVRDDPVVRRGVAGAVQGFGAHAWSTPSEPDAWRPLAVATFAVEAPVWGKEGAFARSFGFHLTNLFLHGLAALLLFQVLVRALPGRSWLAGAAALLFAVHPLATGAVTSFAGRADLLASVLCLATALVWRRATRDAPALLPLVGLGYLLALAAKESAVGLPLALLVLDAGGGLRPDRRRRLLGGAALAVGLAVYLLLSAARWPAFPGSLTAGVIGVGRTAFAFFVPLSVTRDVSEVGALTGGWDLALGAVVTIVALAGLVPAWRSRRVAPAAAGAVAFVLLLLAQSLLAPAGSVVVGRFAYVALPGLAVVGGVLVEALAARVGLGRRAVRVAAVACAGGLVVALGSLARAEGRVWKDDLSFARALVDRYPHDVRFTARLAWVEIRDAEADREAAAGLPSDDPRCRALVASANRRSAAARPDFVTATELRPDFPDGWLGLGAVDLFRADFQNAEESLKRGLSLEPGLRSREALATLSQARRRFLTESYLRLARAVEAQGRVDEAGSWLHTAAVDLAPDDADVLLRAGQLLVKAHRFTDARATLLRALAASRTPEERDHVRTVYEDARRAARGVADAAMKRAHDAESRGADGYREARDEYESALDADPTRFEGAHRLAWLYGEWFGSYRDALDVIDRAEKHLRTPTGAPLDDRAAGELRRFEAEREKLQRLVAAQDDPNEGNGEDAQPPR